MLGLKYGFKQSSIRRTVREQAFAERSQGFVLGQAHQIPRQSRNILRIQSDRSALVAPRFRQHLVDPCK